MQKQTFNLLHFAEHQKNAKTRPEINIYELFNQDAKRAWNKSLTIAKQRQSKTVNLNSEERPSVSVLVTPIDLFLALLEHQSIQLIFIRLGVNPADVKTILQNYAAFSIPASTNELNQIPFVAFGESLKLHNKTIDPLMLLCALGICLPEEHIIQAIFLNINLSVDKLEVLSSWIFHLDLLKEELDLFKKLSKFKPEKEINVGLTSVPTFYLDHFSLDLTHQAKHGRLPIALGRREDLSEIFKLVSEGKKNIVIKGLEGSGRTALINELAYRMATEQVPQVWEDKRLIKLEISGILGSPQKCENTFVQALKEATHAGNIVLVIEDLSELAKTQSTSGLNLLEILLNFLENHELTVIGTTTIADYTDYLQTAPNFEEIFIPYELKKLSQENILLDCCMRVSFLEIKDKCFFLYQAIQQAVDLTNLYIKGLSQPQKAIAVLVEAASRAKSSEKKIVTEALIQKIISEKTHIPTATFTQDEAAKLLRLEETLSKFIVGQKQAITAVAEGLRRARSGLASVLRPLASFLFLGPTGVGKTEVARVLAATYFGEAEPRTDTPSGGSSTGEKYLLRLDMSEYQGPDGITKLLGTSNAKVDPPLIKHLKNYPFCLLLMDEFEKASLEVLNLFLQILEDGRLTTGKGETIDLTHCLIIATSNAGSREIQEGIKNKSTLDQIKLSLFDKTLNTYFAPELLNRFDGIILFSPLSENEFEQVSFLQLQYLQNELLKKGIKAQFTNNVVKDIAQKAYNPALGARPIRRYIQDHLESFVAKLILSKEISRGSQVTIDFKNNGYLIT